MATRSRKNTHKESTASTHEQASSQNTVEQPEQAPQVEKQSQLATILVGLLIIASGLLVYNYFQKATAPDTTNQNQQQKQSENKVSDNKSKEDAKKNTEKSQSKEGQYEVMPGDSLWSIAEKAYGDGNQWQKIADANTIQNNAYGNPTVEIGQVLNIPDSAAIAQQPSPTPATDKSIASVQDLHETPSTAIQTYTVQSGDTLWSIAESVYGNGNDWVKIYNDPHNQLGLLPDGRPLVHVGNQLYIPSIR